MHSNAPHGYPSPPPQRYGQRNGQLCFDVNAGIATSANLTVGGVTFVVTQAAALVSAPVATLSASQLNFGSQQMGKQGKSTKTQSVTLKNSGGGTLTVNSLTAGGADPADFVRSGTCAVGASLTAGQSCTLVYAFSPTGPGSKSATLGWEAPPAPSPWA
jgi:hypothetical protein